MRRVLYVLLAVAVGLCATTAQADKPSKAKGLPRVKQELVAPPMVPKHSIKAEGGPKIVEVKMEVEERKIVIDQDGTTVNAMTFNGTVPGPLIVVHEGDYVELTLVNRSRKAPGLANP